MVWKPYTEVVIISRSLSVETAMKSLASRTFATVELETSVLIIVTMNPTHSGDKPFMWTLVCEWSVPIVYIATPSTS